MSADNIIYVKQEDDDKWVVWHDSASNEEPRPHDDDPRFDDKSQALMAAAELLEDIGYVEYGIAMFDVPEEES